MFWKLTILLFLSFLTCNEGAAIQDGAINESAQGYPTLIGVLMVISLIVLVALCGGEGGVAQGNLIPTWCKQVGVDPAIDTGFSGSSDGINIVNNNQIHRTRKGAFETDGARWGAALSKGKHIFEIYWPAGHRGTYASVGVGTEDAPLLVKPKDSLVGCNRQSWGFDIVRKRLFHDGEMLGLMPRSGTVPDKFYMMIDCDGGTLGFATDHAYWGAPINIPRESFPVFAMIGSSCENSQITMVYKGSEDKSLPITEYRHNPAPAPVPARAPGPSRPAPVPKNGGNSIPTWATMIAPDPALDTGFTGSSDGINILNHNQLHRTRKGAFETDGARWGAELSKSKHVFEIFWPASNRGAMASVGVGSEDAPLFVKPKDSLVGCNKQSWGLDIVRKRLLHNGEMLGTMPRSGMVPDKFYMLVDCDGGTVGYATDHAYWGAPINIPRAKFPVYAMIGSMCENSQITMVYKGSENKSMAPGSMSTKTVAAEGGPVQVTIVNNPGGTPGAIGYPMPEPPPPYTPYEPSAPVEEKAGPPADAVEVEKDTPPVDEGEKATPPVDEGEKATPPVDDVEKATPPADEGEKVPPPADTNDAPKEDDDKAETCIAPVQVSGI